MITDYDTQVGSQSATVGKFADQITGEGQRHRIRLGVVKFSDGGDPASYLDMGSGEIKFPARLTAAIDDRADTATAAADSPAYFVTTINGGGDDTWNTNFPINVILDAYGSDTAQRRVYLEVDSTGFDSETQTLALDSYNGNQIYIDWDDLITEMGLQGTASISAADWTVTLNVDLTLGSPMNHVADQANKSSTTDVMLLTNDHLNGDLVLVDGNAGLADGADGKTYINLVSWAINNPGNGNFGEVQEPDGDGYTDQNCFRTVVTNGRIYLQMFADDATALGTHLSTLQGFDNDGLTLTVTAWDSVRQDSAEMTLYIVSPIQPTWFGNAATASTGQSIITHATSANGWGSVGINSRVYWGVNASRNLSYGVTSTGQNGAQIVVDNTAVEDFGSALNIVFRGYKVVNPGGPTVDDAEVQTTVDSVDQGTATLHLSAAPPDGYKGIVYHNGVSWVRKGMEATPNEPNNTNVITQLDAETWTVDVADANLSAGDSFVCYFHNEGSYDVEVSASDTVAHIVGSSSAGTLSGVDVVGADASNQLVHAYCPAGLRIVHDKYSPEIVTGAGHTATDTGIITVDGADMDFSRIQSDTDVNSFPSAWYDINGNSQGNSSYVRFNFAAGEAFTTTDGSAISLSGTVLTFAQHGRLQTVEWPTGDDAFSFHVLQAPTMTDGVILLPRDLVSGNYYAPRPYLKDAADGVSYVTGLEYGDATTGLALASLTDVTGGTVDNTAVATANHPWQFDVDGDNNILLATTGRADSLFTRTTFGAKTARQIRMLTGVTSNVASFRYRALWDGLLGCTTELSELGHEGVVHLHSYQAISADFILTITLNGTTYNFHNSAGADSAPNYYLSQTYTTVATYGAALATKIETIIGNSFEATLYGQRLFVAAGSGTMSTLTFQQPSEYTAASWATDTGTNWLIGGLRPWVVEPYYTTSTIVAESVTPRILRTYDQVDPSVATTLTESVEFTTADNLGLFTLTIPSIGRPLTAVRADNNTDALLSWDELADASDFSSLIALNGNNHEIEFLIPTSHTQGTGFTPLTDAPVGIPDFGTDEPAMSAWINEVTYSEVSNSVSNNFAIASEVNSSYVYPLVRAGAVNDARYVATIPTGPSTSDEFSLYFHQISSPTAILKNTDGETYNNTDSLTADPELVVQLGSGDTTTLFTIETSINDQNTLYAFATAAVNGQYNGENLLATNIDPEPAGGAATVLTSSASAGDNATWTVTLNNDAAASWFANGSRSAITMSLNLRFGATNLDNADPAGNDVLPAGKLRSMTVSLRILPAIATPTVTRLVDLDGTADEAETYDDGLASSSYRIADTAGNTTQMHVLHFPVQLGGTEFVYDVSLSDETYGHADFWRVALVAATGSNPTTTTSGTTSAAFSNVSSASGLYFVHLLLAGAPQGGAYALPTITVTETHDQDSNYSETLTLSPSVSPMATALPNGRLYRYTVAEITNFAWASDVHESANQLRLGSKGSFGYTFDVQYGLGSGIAGDSPTLDNTFSIAAGAGSLATDLLLVTPSTATINYAATEEVSGNLFNRSSITLVETNNLLQLASGVTDVTISCDDPGDGANPFDTVVARSTAGTTYYHFFQALTALPSIEARRLNFHVRKDASFTITSTALYAINMTLGADEDEATGDLVQGGLFLQNDLTGGGHVPVLQWNTGFTVPDQFSIADGTLTVDGNEVAAPSNTATSVDLEFMDETGTASHVDFLLNVLPFVVPSFALANPIHDISEIDGGNIQADLTLAGGLSGSYYDEIDDVITTIALKKSNATNDGADDTTLSTTQVTGEARASGAITIAIDAATDGIKHGSVLQFELSSSGYTLPTNELGTISTDAVAAGNGSVELWTSTLASHTLTHSSLSWSLSDGDALYNVPTSGNVVSMLAQGASAATVATVDSIVNGPPTAAGTYFSSDAALVFSRRSVIATWTADVAGAATEITFAEAQLSVADATRLIFVSGANAAVVEINGVPTNDGTDTTIALTGTPDLSAYVDAGVVVAITNASDPTLANVRAGGDITVAQQGSGTLTQFMHLYDTELIEAYTAQTSGHDFGTYAPADEPETWSASFNLNDALRRDVFFRAEGSGIAPSANSNWRYPFQQYDNNDVLVVPRSGTIATSQARRAVDMLVAPMTAVSNVVLTGVERSVYSVVGFADGQAVSFVPAGSGTLASSDSISLGTITLSATPDPAISAGDLLYTSYSGGTAYGRPILVTDVSGADLTVLDTTGVTDGSTLYASGGASYTVDDPEIGSGVTRPTMTFLANPGNVTGVAGTSSTLVNYNQGGINPPVYDIGSAFTDGSLVAPAESIDSDSVHFTVLEQYALAPLNAPLPENFVLRVENSDKTLFNSGAATITVHHAGGTTDRTDGEFIVGPDWDEVGVTPDLGAWADGNRISVSCTAPGTYFLVMRPLGYNQTDTETSETYNTYYAVVPFTILGTPQVYGYGVTTGNQYAALLDDSRAHVDNMCLRVNLDELDVRLSTDSALDENAKADCSYVVRLEAAYATTTYDSNADVGSRVSTAVPTATDAWVDITDMLNSNARALPGVAGAFSFNENAGGDGKPFLVINPADGVAGQRLLTIVGLAERWRQTAENTYTSSLSVYDDIATEILQSFDANSGTYAMGRMYYRLRIRAYASDATPSAPFNAANTPFTDLLITSTRDTNNDGNDDDADYELLPNPANSGAGAPTEYIAQTLSNVFADRGTVTVNGQNIVYGPFTRTFVSMTAGFDAASTILAPVAYTTVDNGFASVLTANGVGDETVYQATAALASTKRHTFAEPRPDIHVKSTSQSYYRMLTTADVSLEPLASLVSESEPPLSSQATSLQNVSEALGNDSFVAADGVGIFNGRFVRARREWDTMDVSAVHIGSDGTTAADWWIAAGQPASLEFSATTPSNTTWSNVGQNSAWVRTLPLYTTLTHASLNWDLLDNTVIVNVPDSGTVSSMLARGDSSGTEVIIDGENVNPTATGRYFSADNAITPVGQVVPNGWSADIAAAATEIYFNESSNSIDGATFLVFIDGTNSLVVEVTSTSNDGTATTVLVANSPDVSSYTATGVFFAITDVTQPALAHLFVGTDVTVALKATSTYTFQLGATDIEAYNPGPYSLLLDLGSGTLGDTDIGSYMRLGSTDSNGFIRCVLSARAGNWAILRALEAPPVGGFTGGSIRLHTMRIWSSEDVNVPVTEQFAYRSAWGIDNGTTLSSMWHKVSQTVNATDGRQAQFSAALSAADLAHLHPGALVYFANDNAEGEVDDISPIYVVEEQADAATINLDRTINRYRAQSGTDYTHAYVLNGYAAHSTLGAGIEEAPGAVTLADAGAALTTGTFSSVSQGNTLFVLNGSTILKTTVAAASDGLGYVLLQNTDITAAAYTTGTAFTASNDTITGSAVDVSGLTTGVATIDVSGNYSASGTLVSSILWVNGATVTQAGLSSAVYEGVGDTTTLTFSSAQDLTGISYVYMLTTALLNIDNEVDLSSNSITVHDNALATNVPVWTGAYISLGASADVHSPHVPGDDSGVRRVTDVDRGMVVFDSAFASETNTILYVSNPLLYNTFQQLAEQGIDNNFFSGEVSVGSGTPSLPSVQLDLQFENIQATYVRLVDPRVDTNPTGAVATFSLSSGGVQYIEEASLRTQTTIQKRPQLPGSLAE